MRVQKAEAELRQSERRLSLSPAFSHRPLSALQQRGMPVTLTPRPRPQTSKLVDEARREVQLQRQEQQRSQQADGSGNNGDVSHATSTESVGTVCVNGQIAESSSANGSTSMDVVNDDEDDDETVDVQADDDDDRYDMGDDDDAAETEQDTDEEEEQARRRERRHDHDVRCIDRDIDLKQRLIDELEQKEFEVARLQQEIATYESRVGQLQEQCKTIEEDRDRVIQSLRGGKDSEKRIEAEKKKAIAQISEKQMIIRQLLSEKRTTTRQMQDVQAKNREAAHLKTEVKSLKNARVALLRKQEVELRKARQADLRHTRQIARKEKELRENAKKIGRLQEEARNRDRVIRQQANTVAGLRQARRDEQPAAQVLPKRQTQANKASRATSGIPRGSGIRPPGTRVDAKVRLLERHIERGIQGNVGIEKHSRRMDTCFTRREQLVRRRSIIEAELREAAAVPTSAGGVTGLKSALDDALQGVLSAIDDEEGAIAVHQDFIADYASQEGDGDEASGTNRPTLSTDDPGDIHIFNRLVELCKKTGLDGRLAKLSCDELARENEDLKGTLRRDQELLEQQTKKLLMEERRRVLLEQTIRDLQAGIPIDDGALGVTINEPFDGRAGGESSTVTRQMLHRRALLEGNSELSLNRTFNGSPKVRKRNATTWRD